MSPRSGRKRVGMTRMDAALDFAAQMGYPRVQVRAKMVGLLKEYGGDVGYRFIEADAYKVLMDAILEEEESKREKASIKTPNAGGPSTSIESACSHTPNTAQIHRGGGIIWKDIGLDKIRSPEKKEDNNTDGFSADEDELMYNPIPSGWAPPPPPPQPLIAATSPPPPTRRRNPSYGWISDDEDEDGEEEMEFVMLTPMESLRSPGGTVLGSPTRRSRWDLRPEDM